jgi:hypothetical protein
VGRPAPQLQAARDARPGARRRRGRTGVLEKRGATCSPTRKSSGAGGTRSAKSSPRSRGRRKGRRGPRWRRSTTPKTATTPSRPRRHSPRPTARSSPKRSRRSPTTSTCCSLSTASPVSTGSTCAPPTRSSRPSQPSGYGSVSPRDPARGPPGSRWRSIIESAQHGWRAVNSSHVVALVRAGAKFENGVLVERPDESASGDTHAALHADPQALTIPLGAVRQFP